MTPFDTIDTSPSTTPDPERRSTPMKKNLGIPIPLAPSDQPDTHHVGTGVDLAQVFVSDDGYAICVICAASVPAKVFHAHLDWHGNRGEIAS